MKTKLLFLAFMVSGLAFYSCDDDDNLKVSDNFKSAFKSLYPNAKNVEWEKKRGYYVADFWRSDMKAEAEAWFNEQAQWTMTVTEISYNDLPQEVKNGYQASEYSHWRLDDTDKVERHEMETVYIIEVEKNNQEYDLYYTPDGTLIKAVLDTDNDHWNYMPSVQ